jgi:hypothetical protein
MGKIIMQTTQQGKRRASRLSPELAAAIRPAMEAATRLRLRGGRFEIYNVVEAVYSVYVDWKHRKTAKRSARALAGQLGIAQRKDMTSIRILIEAVLPEANHKQKSRWVRALEYIYSQDVPATRLRQFARLHDGLAGCARAAVEIKRKRRRSLRDFPEGDWGD